MVTASFAIISTPTARWEPASQMVVIVGNPNAGKKLATIALAIVFITILVTAVIAVRRQSAPTQRPPLHPSTIGFLSSL
jgi:hypothetical protein